MGAEITADCIEIKIAGCLTMSGRDTWMVRSQRHRRRENRHRDRVTDNRDIVHVCECPADTIDRYNRGGVCVLVLYFSIQIHVAVTRVQCYM